MTPVLQTGAVRRSKVGLVLFTLAGLSLPSLAFAADEAFVLRSRAAQLATNGDCSAALPLIDQAKAIDPAGDDATALMAGRCFISTKNFAAAKPALERAVAHDPSSGDARLALGVAKYHLGEKDAARADLEQAQKMLPNNPEAELYLGMILLEQENPAAAVNRLDRSRSLSGDTIEPASNYYAALAHSEAGDTKRAEELLRGVQTSAPGTVWAERAGEALAQADARRAAAGPSRWLTVQAGLDYDSNISLRSDAVAQPDDVSHDGDGRAWWGVDGGAELFRSNGWGGGVGANYTGSQPFRSDDFDQHFITASPWLDRELGSKTLLRLAPEGGVGFFDGDEFLRFGGIRPELRHDFGRGGMGSLYVRYAYNDFRYEEVFNSTDPLTPDRTFTQQRNYRDRDGHDVIAGYDHLIGIGDSTTLRGGVFAHDYTAKGAEYDYTGGGGWLGLRQTLPMRFILDLQGGAEFDDYESDSSFLLPGETDHAREDLIGTAGVVLTRPITDWLSISARYRYLNSDSNTDVFDYDRHIVGAFVTIGLLR